jgi:hypothetical protein
MVAGKRLDEVSPGKNIASQTVEAKYRITLAKLFLVKFD